MILRVKESRRADGSVEYQVLDISGPVRVDVSSHATRPKAEKWIKDQEKRTEGKT
jgi:hypothetical protein